MHHTQKIDQYNPKLGYHPSAIPLDIRLNLTSPSTTHTLNWGILGCSKAAHDFTQALKFLRSNGLPHNIISVGSRCSARAASFASLHEIPFAQTYLELCQNDQVDIVYIASLHPFHREHAEMALRNGKHVLIEKPITMSSDDAQYLYDLGKELNLFVGEGMWTRFFPAIELARLYMGEENDDSTKYYSKIGTVRVVNCDFSIDGNDVGPYPSDTIYNKNDGGGASYCLLPYIVGATMLPFGSTPPERITANGILADEDVGDLAMGMTLTFNNGKSSNDGSSPPGEKSIASGVCGYLAESPETSVYSAKRGRITINSPSHCPTSMTVWYKPKGRGNGSTSETSDSANSSITTTFPLPENTPEIKQSGGIRLPNSMGFIYEAEAVRRLIGAGCGSFPQWTPEESVGCLRIVEEMMRQVHGNK